MSSGMRSIKYTGFHAFSSFELSHLGVSEEPRHAGCRETPLGGDLALVKDVTSLTWVNRSPLSCWSGQKVKANSQVMSHVTYKETGCRNI